MTPNLAPSIPVGTVAAEPKVIGQFLKYALWIAAPLAIASFLILRGISVAAEAQPDSPAGLAGTLTRGFYCTCAVSGLYLAARACRALARRKAASQPKA